MAGHCTVRPGAGRVALCARNGGPKLGTHPELRLAVCDVGTRSEYCGGLCRLAGPGLYRFLCRGRLRLGIAGLAAFWLALAVLGGAAVWCLDGGGVWCTA